MATVDERLKRVIAAWLDVKERDIVPETSFLEDLNADSLDLVDLMMAIEEEFSLDISPEDMEQLETVQEAKDYIEKQLRSQLKRDNEEDLH